MRERSLEPIWYVLIPGENEYGPGYIECFISSDPNDPGNHHYGEAAGFIVTEEYIESQLHTNGGL